MPALAALVFGSTYFAPTYLVQVWFSSNKLHRNITPHLLFIDLVTCWHCEQGWHLLSFVCRFCRFCVSYGGEEERTLRQFCRTHRNLLYHRVMHKTAPPPRQARLNLSNGRRRLNCSETASRVATELQNSRSFTFRLIVR